MLGDKGQRTIYISLYILAYPLQSHRGLETIPAYTDWAREGVLSRLNDISRKSFTLTFILANVQTPHSQLAAYFNEVIILLQLHHLTLIKSTIHLFSHCKKNNVCLMLYCCFSCAAGAL